MELGMSNKASPLKSLRMFLEKYKIHKNDKETTSNVVTFGGDYMNRNKYNISDKAYSKFLKLYSACLGHTDKLHFIEQIRDKKYTPLLGDLDFRFKEKDRQYDESHIESVIWEYKMAIEKYLNIPMEELDCYVFEKEKPNYDSKKDWYKDGIHLMFPHVVTDIGTRLLITDQVISQAKADDLFRDLAPLNNYEDIFDISVQKSTGWCLYGSRKDGGSTYKLTARYKFIEENNDCTVSRFLVDNLVGKKLKTLPPLFSVRKFNDKEKVKFDNSEFDLDDFERKKEQVCIKYGVKKAPREMLKKKKSLKNISNEINTDSDDDESDENGDIENIHFKIPTDTLTNDEKECRSLVKLLSSKRAKSGNYNDWIRVCWAIVNVSHRLKEDWIKFSKRGDYDQVGCFKIWNNALENSYVYCLPSLRKWARDDNPKGYNDYIESSIDTMIREAESGTHYDIAKVLYQMYKHKYVCSDMKANLWYEFKNHRWKIVPNAHTLKLLISEELTKKFCGLMSAYYNKGGIDGGANRESVFKQADKVRKIVNDLKNSSFKNRVLEECACLFYKDNFEELLDSNRHLIGFDNGIFDLEQGIFRDGLPEDYVTLTCGYNFKDVRNDEHIALIEKFFSQLHPDKDMRNYVLTLLSSYLEGTNREQKFIIWTGSGSNGKSSLIGFFHKAFGEYVGELPPTLLTRKSGNASNATPELADLRGKRFVVFEEPENDDQIYVGNMKRLTGSDWIYARPLYREGFRYLPQFKLLLACNKLPVIPSDDGGTWRRIRVTPFESEFLDPEDKIRDPKRQFNKDKKLSDKLDEMKGSFMWYLINEYYLKIYKIEGLREPNKVTLYTKNYRKDSDVFCEFIDDNIQFVDNKKEKINIADLWDTFKAWFNLNQTGKRPPPKKDLRNYFAEKKEYEFVGGYLLFATFKMDNESDSDDSDSDDM